jgi:hypothetical protein
MNDLDDTLPSIVTQKKRTKKALKCSREARSTAKARGDGFSYVTKKLVFTDRLNSENCTADLQGCSTKTSGPEILEPVKEIEEGKIEFSLGGAILAIEYPE